MENYTVPYFNNYTKFHNCDPNISFIKAEILAIFFPSILQQCPIHCDALIISSWMERKLIISCISLSKSAQCSGPQFLQRENDGVKLRLLESFSLLIFPVSVLLFSTWALSPKRQGYDRFRHREWPQTCADSTCETDVHWRGNRGRAHNRNGLPGKTSSMAVSSKSPLGKGFNL